MSQIRAKFVVNSITRTQSSVWQDGKSIPQEVQTVKLFAVTSGSDENKQFFASTPSGEINLSYINKDLFELNKEYYIDFTLAQ